MLPMKTRDQLYRHEPKPRNAAVAPCRRDAASRHRYRYRLFVKPLNFTAVRCYEKKASTQTESQHKKMRLLPRGR